MKLLIVFFLTLLFVASNAQYSLDELTPDLREVIENDQDLLNDFLSGSKKIETANKLRTATFILYGTTVAGFAVASTSNSEYIDSRFMFGMMTSFFSLVTASVTSSIAFFKRRKGKKMVDEVINYSRGTLGKGFHGSIEIQSTGNSIGIFYSF